MSQSKKIIFFIVAILILARIALPYIMKHYVNKALKDIDGYEGRIEDLDLNLYRGAYSFQNLTIERTEGKMTHPFARIENIDLSVDWNALFKGHMVGKVQMQKPVINFAIDSTAKVTQTGIENNWVVTVKKVVPFNANLNVLQVSNAKIEYRDYSKNPQVHISIDDITITAKNLSNVNEKDVKLPSSIEMSGKSFGKGLLNFHADVNILKKIPDFDLNMELTEVRLDSLNNFTNAYGRFDFEEGNLAVFIELLMDDGKYVGYVKPILENVKIMKWDDEDKLSNNIWEGFISAVSFTLKNHKKERIGSKVPIEGSMDKTKTEIWQAIISIFKNAFIQAIPKKIDHTINSKKELDKEE